MLLPLTTAATASLLFLGASAHPASPLAIAVATEQFKNAKIVPDILPEFAPIGLVTFNYSTVTNRTTIGVALTKEQVLTAPQNVYIRGTEASEADVGGPFNLTTYNYTVLTFDAGVPGANSSLYRLHWLANGWTYGEFDDHTVTLVAPTNSVVVYAPPSPPAGSGPHRYITLVYAQPSNFTAPATPAYNATGAPRFNLTTYRREAGFGPAIAGTYFTVEDGTATVTYASTVAVDSKTFPQYTPPATATPTSGASESVNIINGVGLGFVGLVLSVLFA